MRHRVDCIVIGAGVIGLAVGRELARSGREVLVLERHDAIGTETSSRNSEVIHAGIYYAAGSLKARLCVEGNRALYAYCAERHIAHRRLGKLIVATNDAEREQLAIYERSARANGVDHLRRVDRAELHDIEPAVVATDALFSPSTGIIDSHELMLALLGDLEAAGGLLVCRAPVHSLESGARRLRVFVGGDDNYELQADRVVNAAGLQAWDVASSCRDFPAAKLPPRYYAIGHYYSLGGASPFQHLVYPVASAGGLGIHVTLDLAGRARFGPDVRWIERIRYDFDDDRREDFRAAIRRYYPGIDDRSIEPAYTGIRPKLSGEGQLPADFVVQGPQIHGVPGLMNLFGIESPGLTACLALAQETRERLEST